MANYGPADLVVEYDNAGATPVDITAHVLSVNDVDVENITEEVRPLGASWAVHKTIGVGQMPEIELSGGYCQLVACRREIWPQRRGAGSDSTGTRHLLPDGEGAISEHSMVGCAGEVPSNAEQVLDDPVNREELLGLLR